MDANFWLGLAAGIPLSILANLITPKTQQWLAKRSSAKAAKQVIQLKEELAELERLVSEPGRLQTYLLEGVLLITLLTSMFAVITGLAFAIGSFFGSPSHVMAFGQLLAVGSAIVVSKECIDVLRKSNRARNLSDYKARVIAQLSELGEST